MFILMKSLTGMTLPQIASAFFFVMRFTRSTRGGRSCGFPVRTNICGL